MLAMITDHDRQRNRVQNIIHIEIPGFYQDRRPAEFFRCDNAGSRLRWEVARLYKI